MLADCVLLSSARPRHRDGLFEIATGHCKRIPAECVVVILRCLLAHDRQREDAILRYVFDLVAVEFTGAVGIYDQRHLVAKVIVLPDAGELI